MAQIFFSGGLWTLVVFTAIMGMIRADCPKGCRCQRRDDCGLLVECRRVKAFPKAYPEGADCIFLNSAALGSLTAAQKQSGLAELPATTKRLDLAEARLGEIGAGWFKHLAELRILNLEFNNLKAIPPYAFQGLPKLKVLWLTGNHYSPDEPEYNKMKAAGNVIKEVSADAFVGLGNLQVLLVHHNKIKSLDDNTFRDLAKLKVLKLLDNPVTRRIRKSDKVFDPIRFYCYHLDLQHDSGDDLEDYWENTRTYLSDEWFEGPPRKKKKMQLHQGHDKHDL